MNVNELSKEAHEEALLKGWYDCDECGGNKYWVDDERDEHNCPKCRGTGKRKRDSIELIMLIVTELSEAVEADRGNDHSPRKHGYGSIDVFTQEGKKRILNSSDFTWDDFKLAHKDTFEDEIADTFIRLFDLCGYLKIDIEKHIEAKMEYNKSRPYKHGKKY